MEYNNLLTKYPMSVGKETKKMFKSPSFFLSKKNLKRRVNTMYKRKIKLITDNQ